MFRRRCLVLFPFGDGECCMPFSVDFFVISTWLYNTLIILHIHNQNYTGEAPGETIANSSAKSNTEPATASGTPAKTSPSAATSAPRHAYYSCASAVGKAPSPDFPTTVSIIFFT